MDLKNFIDKTMTSANDAKNFMSFLIGYSFSGDAPDEAILGLYDSLPAEYKKDKKIFSQVFLKFFTKFEITDKSYPYYKEYRDSWPASSQESVQKLNPNWNWGEQKTQYKNSMEFCKALSTITRSNKKLFYSFMKEHESTVDALIKKNKNKFSENFQKYDCWNNMIMTDYAAFKDFCLNYGFDILPIIKENFVNNYYGFGWSFAQFKQQDLLSLFKDVQQQKDFFNNSNFLSNNGDRSKDYPNIFHITLKCIKSSYHDLFVHLYENYPEEIEKCMQSYLDYRQKPNIEDVNDWKSAVQTISQNVKSNYNREPFHWSEIETIQQLISGGNIIKVIMLDKQLSIKDSNPKRKMKV